MAKSGLQPIVLRENTATLTHGMKGPPSVAQGSPRCDSSGAHVFTNVVSRTWTTGAQRL